jgi:hypothetical protein
VINLFGSLNKQDPDILSALAKQKAVNELWKIQTDTTEIIQRGNQAECLSNKEAESWIDQLNLLRQIIQDRFLLAINLETIQKISSAAVSEFNQKAISFQNQIVDLERNMNVETRIKNIISKIFVQFNLLHQQKLIDVKTMEYLRNEVDIYHSSLKRNINDYSMRSEVKIQLLHELIDDFYSELNQIYTKVKSTQKRI